MQLVNMMHGRESASCYPILTFLNLTACLNSTETPLPFNTPTLCFLMAPWTRCCMCWDDNCLSYIHTGSSRCQPTRVFTCFRDPGSHKVISVTFAPRGCGFDLCFPACFRLFQTSTGMLVSATKLRQRAGLEAIVDIMAMAKSDAILEHSREQAVILRHIRQQGRYNNNRVS